VDNGGIASLNILVDEFFDTIKILLKSLECGFIDSDQYDRRKVNAYYTIIEKCKNIEDIDGFINDADVDWVMEGLLP